MRFGGVTALSDAAFSVAAREILGIIGSNGAGKTTLFDVCTGFLAPTAGTIRLGGVNQARMRQQLENVPRGGSVWTFALMTE